MTAKLGACLALLCAGLAIASTAPAPPVSVDYVASATVVAKDAGQQAVLDDGGVVCSSSGASIGGGCIPFGNFDSIKVSDQAFGSTLAFQVCIDNNGDGACSGSNGHDPCADDIFFSHSDKGDFFNALGPLPTGFRAGCPGGPFNGYVVFLCAGAHVLRQPGTALPLPVPGSGHVHAASQGSITGVKGGSGYGDFCQPQGLQEKVYVLA